MSSGSEVLFFFAIVAEVLSDASELLADIAEQSHDSEHFLSLDQGSLFMFHIARIVAQISQCTMAEEGRSRAV